MPEQIHNDTLFNKQNMEYFYSAALIITYIIVYCIYRFCKRPWISCKTLAHEFYLITVAVISCNHWCLASWFSWRIVFFVLMLSIVTDVLNNWKFIKYFFKVIKTCLLGHVWMQIIEHGRIDIPTAIVVVIAVAIDGESSKITEEELVKIDLKIQRVLYNKCSYELVTITGNPLGNHILKGRFGQRAVSLKIIDGEEALLRQNEENICNSRRSQIKLVQLVATGTIENYRWLSFEYLDHNLQEFMEDKMITKSVYQCKNVIAQMIFGLEFIHNNGYAFCCLSPGKILLESFEGYYRVKYRFYGHCTPLGSMVHREIEEGKLYPYLPAELRQSETFEASKNIDTYSLGKLFYFIIAGGVSDEFMLGVDKYNVIPDLVPYRDFGMASETISKMLDYTNPNQPRFLDLVDDAMIWSDGDIVNYVKQSQEVIGHMKWYSGMRKHQVYITPEQHPRITELTIPTGNWFDRIENPQILANIEKYAENNPSFDAQNRFNRNCFSHNPRVPIRPYPSGFIEVLLCPFPSYIPVLISVTTKLKVHEYIMACIKAMR